MTFALTSRERRGLLLLLVVVVAVRLATLGAYPLLDPTEQFYAHMALREQLIAMEAMEEDM